MLPDPGQILLPRVPNRQPARINRYDSRANAAAALGGYLRAARFVKWGAEAPDTEFQLAAVLEEWPDSFQVLQHPSVAITDVAPQQDQASALLPVALEDTWNVFGAETVLWKLAEASILFQLDFFTQSVPDREAIAASLPGLFAPGEDRANVVLTGHPIYYCRPVRCALESYWRADTAGPVYENERRLVARVRCDTDVVELRCGAVPLTVRAELEITELALSPLTPPESSKLEPGCCPPSED